MKMLTPELARAIGQDAGNANARKNGREVWNEEDRNVADKLTAELIGLIGYKPAEA